MFGNKWAESEVLAFLIVHSHLSLLSLLSAIETLSREYVVRCICLGERYGFRVLNGAIRFGMLAQNS